MRITKSLPARFWAKVNKHGPFPPRRSLGRCWIWTASKNPDGYGQIKIATNEKRGAHRVAWKLAGRRFAHGKEIDHLCRNTSCVRYTHLELVTHRINMLRGNGVGSHNAHKTYCSNGHPLFGKTMKVYSGQRTCLVCKRLSSKRMWCKLSRKPWRETPQGHRYFRLRRQGICTVCGQNRTQKAVCDPCRESGVR